MGLRRTQSVVNLDPIERQQKKDDSNFMRLLKTRPHGGIRARKTRPIGHYLFVGKQRHGKTASALWYLERLTKQYKKRGFKVLYYSNLDIGIPVEKYTLSSTIRNINYEEKTVHLFLVDEIQSYFPKDTRDKATLAEIDKLVSDFSQLGKRNIYVLSTAQIYGRVNKSIREQCLYMVHCRFSKINRKFVNDFIDGDDILCDDLGRWAGRPQFIITHGLSKMKYDTHKMITK